MGHKTKATLTPEVVINDCTGHGHCTVPNVQPTKNPVIIRNVCDDHAVCKVDTPASMSQISPNVTVQEDCVGHAQCKTGPAAPAANLLLQNLAFPYADDSA